MLDWLSAVKLREPKTWKPGWHWQSVFTHYYELTLLNDSQEVSRTSAKFPDNSESFQTIWKMSDNVKSFQKPEKFSDGLNSFQMIYMDGWICTSVHGLLTLSYSCENYLRTFCWRIWCKNVFCALSGKFLVLNSANWKLQFLGLCAN